MDKIENDTITENYEALVGNIRVYNIVDYLVQEKVLTVEDSERCTSKVHETDRDAARRLVNLILKSSQPNVLQKFIESLEDHYDYLADQLKKTRAKNLGKLHEQRRKAKPLMRTQHHCRDSAFTSLQDNNTGNICLDDISLSLPANIVTRDDNISSDFPDIKSTATEKTPISPNLPESISANNLNGCNSLSKRESEEIPDSEENPLKYASGARRHSTDKGNDGQGKRRFGSNRRRMKILSSGTSKEAGVENLQRLSYEDAPEGFDEVDTFDPSLISSIQQTGICYVFMERRSMDLPVGVHLQEDPAGDFIISKILSEGLAIQQADLKVGDVLVYVNGKEVRGKSLDEVKDLIDNSFASPQLIFGVHRTGRFHKKTVEVTLERASMNLSYGLRYIFGRSRPRKPSDDSLYVTRIERGSVAEMEGVKVGDEILAINGLSIEKVKHSQEVEKLFQQSCTVTLRLTRIGYSETISNNDL